MRRHKAATMQINVRLDTTVVDQLEAHAKANRVSFSEEVRQRIIASLVPKLDPSLADFRAAWLRRLRDVVETSARKDPEAAKAIEATWRILQRVDAKFAVFCGDVATELDPCRGTDQVYELVWGTPTLPNETKVKAK